MIDINVLRKTPDVIDKSLHKRDMEPQAMKIYEIDKKYRIKASELQTLQNKRNENAKKLGVVKSKKNNSQNDLIEALLSESSNIKNAISSLEKETNKLKSELNYALLTLPNILSEDVPIGINEEDNIIKDTFGTIKTFENPILSHDEIGTALGLIDFRQAAIVSGSRFVYLYGDMARLERALINFMMDIHTNKFGYTPVSPPLLVNEDSLIGTGQLPKFEGNNLFSTNNGKYLIPTAEVSLTNIVRNKIINIEDFPIRFVANTPCFRLEAGAASRDTKGMIRQHQFSKVELVSIVTPESSENEHERKVFAAQEILKLLELPFRTVTLCSGDTGSGASKTYDLEVWLPSQNCYREISSCSNCLDYQSRRMKTRFYRKNEKHTIYPHTLNGSGLAVGRSIVAIIENYQINSKNGIKIEIPKILQPYMAGQKFIEMEKK